MVRIGSIAAIALISITAGALARPHYTTISGSTYDHYEAGDAEGMALIQTTQGPRCICASGWSGADRRVQGLIVEGPQAGTEFPLPGSPEAAPGARIKPGPNGLIAYRCTDPNDQPSIAVVGPIAGPGVAPPVAYVSGITLDPTGPEFDFDFAPNGVLHIAARTSPASGRNYNLMDAFPQQWSAQTYATANVSCETLTVKIGRIEFVTRGTRVVDDLIVAAGQLSTVPPVVQVSATLRSNPASTNVITLEGVYQGHSIAAGKAYVALTGVQGSPSGALLRVFDGTTPVGPTAVATVAGEPVSGASTGKRSHKPIVWKTTTFSQGALVASTLALTRFDQAVELNTTRLGNSFEGALIESLGWNENAVDENGDVFFTVQLSNQTSVLAVMPGATRSCPGDGDGSFTVGFADITASLNGWGATEDPTEPLPVLGDSNYDGAVNFADITASLANFGADCR